MFWLILHQWILLVLAFSLGLLIGWWIWARRSEDEVSEEPFLATPEIDNSPE